MATVKIPPALRQEIIDHLLAFAMPPTIGAEKMLDHAEWLVDNMTVQQLTQIETEMRMSRRILEADDGDIDTD